MRKVTAYTPLVGKEFVVTLKRLSWAAGLPMTSTLELLISTFVTSLRSKLPCETCKDQKCDECLFKNKKLNKGSLKKHLKEVAESRSADSATKQLTYFLHYTLSGWFLQPERVLFS